MLCVHERTIEGENKTCTICFNCFSLQYAVSGKKTILKVPRIALTAQICRAFAWSVTVKKKPANVYESLRQLGFNLSAISSEL